MNSNLMQQIIYFLKKYYPPIIMEKYQELFFKLEEVQNNYEECFFLKPLYFMNYLELTLEKESWEFHCLLLSLFEQINLGNLCLKIDEKNSFFAYITSLQDKKYIQFFQKENIQSTQKPLIVVLEDNCAWVYFQKQWNAFIQLQSHLNNILYHNENTNKKKPEPLNETNTPFKLNNQQKTAVQSALQNNFNIITGGPGTGKTTVSNFILAQMLQSLKNQKKDFNIIMLAPTGRAKTRIEENIQENGSSLIQKFYQKGFIQIQTVHKFIQDRHTELKPSLINGETKKASYKPDALFIDEISMVSPYLFIQVMNWLHPSSKIILLGDKHQLPAISEGDLLDYLLNHPRLTGAIYELTKIFRSREKSLLQQFVLQLQDISNKTIQNHQESLFLRDFTSQEKNQEQKTPELDLLLDKINVEDLAPIFQNQDGTGAYLLSLSDLKITWYELLMVIFKYLYIPLYEKSFSQYSLFREESLSQLLQNIKEIKFLSPVKEGTFGTQYINSVINEAYQGYFKTDVGIPVMVKDNNYRLNLFNGDTGIISHSEKGQEVLFNKDSTIKKYLYKNIPYVEYAFSNTIHKSQGSEYSTVFLVLPSNTPKHLLNLPILYTGVSRAKQKLIIISDKSTVKRALFQNNLRINGLI